MPERQSRKTCFVSTPPLFFHATYLPGAPPVLDLTLDTAFITNAALEAHPATHQRDVVLPES